MKRNRKHENTDSKQVFKKTSKKKSVDLNMNFIDEAIFQKKLRKMDENSFRSSYKSSFMSINSYDGASNEKSVETLNSLNFFESDFRSSFFQPNFNQNQNTHEISLSIQKQSNFRSRIFSFRSVFFLNRSFFIFFEILSEIFFLASSF